MAKWADYIITGVWFESNKNGSEHISHVMVHEDLGDKIAHGNKINVSDVILSIRNGKTFITASWSYTNKNWIPGATVVTILRDNRYYLRTKRDKVVYDNLDNLINMQIIA